MKFFKFFLILLSLQANTTFAGFIGFEDRNYEDIKVGDEILITINLDTENESYNTVSGSLFIDESFEIKQVKTGNSIISAWIENPSKSKNNTINFSGIIAGGFNGQGTIFEIIAIPKIAGSYISKLQNILIYKNDGSGTEEKNYDKNLNIFVREILSGELNSKIIMIDKISPEKFIVELIQDKNIENGKYILIFEATDKGTGVKTYEVLEGKNIFKQAESPYVLKNQRINERIYVKAIDYEGNERVSKVEIPKKVCFKVKCFDQNIIITILIVAFIGSFIIWRRQSKEFKKISKEVS